MPKKHILIASNTEWSITNFRSSLIQRLAEQGFQITIVAPDFADRSGFSKINLTNVPYRRNFFPQNKLNPFGYLLSILSFFKILHEINPDFILSFTTQTNLSIGLANRLYKTRHIPTINGYGRFLPHSKLSKNILIFLFRIALRSSYLIIFQKKEDKEFYKQQIEYDSVNNMKIINGSGIDISFYQSELKRCKTKQKAIGFAGRPIKEKGFDSFVALAQHAMDKNLPYRFYLCFPNIKSERAKWDRIIEKKVKNLTNLTFLGYLDDIRIFFQKIDVLLLLSSYGEGIPRTYLEALASGVLCVTSENPAFNIGADDAEYRLIFQHNNQFLHKNQLRMLVDQINAIDLSRAEAIQINALRLLEQKFSSEKIDTKYMKLLHH